MMAHITEQELQEATELLRCRSESARKDRRIEWLADVTQVRTTALYMVYMGQMEPDDPFVAMALDMDHGGES